MNIFDSLKTRKTAFWGSLILSLIIIYPNINELLWSVLSPVGSYHYAPWGTAKVIYFIYRFVFFFALTRILIRTNIRDATVSLKVRFWKSFAISLAAYVIYLLVGITIEYAIRTDCFTRVLILQFLIAWLVPVLIGQIYNLTVIQREKEREIERLRTENLQSRVDALGNQINPHFFFNSLNGLTALVAAKRYDETGEYVAKLSNIFRYILQSDKKGLVTLREELKFLDAYRYLIEIRYSGKITFTVEVPESYIELRLPVLSLLPLVENIVKHNIIDSNHHMTVNIRTLDGKELLVSNPIHRKLDPEPSNGIGITNLTARFRLLTGKEIKVCEENEVFTVILPLTDSCDESTDS